MRLQVLGPEVELLTAPEQEPCVMRGTIPPGVAPSPDALQRFAAVAARYGHWLASPEENAASGI